MQNININNDKIKSPLIACFINIISYIMLLLICIKYLVIVIYFLILIIIYSIILIYVHIGLGKREYKYYNKGLIISFILSIILTIFKIILIILSAIYELKKGNESGFQLTAYILFITIIIDWILTRFLFSIKNDVKKYCEPTLTIQNLINENNEN